MNASRTDVKSDRRPIPWWCLVALPLLASSAATATPLRYNIDPDHTYPMMLQIQVEAVQDK